MEPHEAFCRSLEPDSYSSLHHDLVNGRHMELEALHGEVVRRARSNRVPVAVTETIYALLRPWAIRNERAVPPRSP